MSEYKPSALREYIDKSELRAVNDDFHVRLSPEFAKKYDAGEYKIGIDLIKSAIREIQSIGIKYPGRANPIFYLYITPNDRGAELLKFPYGFKTGGRPVQCFDADGFSFALGYTESMFTIRPKSMGTLIGDIHEVTHLIFNTFSNNNASVLAEGLCETVPFYVLNYEGKYEKHLTSIAGAKIHPVHQLLNKWDDIVIPDKEERCQQWPTYISSYLFLRGVIQKIEQKYKINKVQALQKFLEFMRSSDFFREFFIYELADFIGMDRTELLHGKSLQESVRADITG